MFASGSAAILGGGKELLDKVADAIEDTPEKIRVEGHTDDLPIGPSLKSDGRLHLETY